MPRLDWQLWFAALRSGDPQALLKEPWLLALSDRLMRNDPYALTLLAGNPFPDAPPNFLRIAVFRYRFADPVTRREHKVWWMRQYRGLYGPVLQRGPENQSSL
jgi:hypothetical protein